MPHVKHLQKVGVAELSGSLPEPLPSLLCVPQLCAHPLPVRFQRLLLLLQTLDAGEEVGRLLSCRGGELCRGPDPTRGTPKRWPTATRGRRGPGGGRLHWAAAGIGLSTGDDGAGHGGGAPEGAGTSGDRAFELRSLENQGPRGSVGDVDLAAAASCRGCGGCDGLVVPGRKARKTSSIGIKALAGKISCSIDREGSPRSAGGRLAVPSLASMRANTVACVPQRPQSSKALFHDRLRSMASTTAATHSMRAGRLSRPSAVMTVAACTVSSNLLLNKANTCVSHGCSAHVIFAGIRK